MRILTSESGQKTQLQSLSTTCCTFYLQPGACCIYNRLPHEGHFLLFAVDKGLVIALASIGSLDLVGKFHAGRERIKNIADLDALPALFLFNVPEDGGFFQLLKRLVDRIDIGGGARMMQE